MLKKRKENASRYIEYFDSKGKLLCHYYNLNNGCDDKLEYQMKGVGVIYFKGGRLVKSQGKRTYGEKSLLPMQYNGKDKSRNEFCYHLTTKEVKEHFYTNGLVSFEKKIGNGIYYINNVGVNIRTKPELGSPVVRVTDCFDKVKIIALGKSETIMPWGKHNWYKIKSLNSDVFTGWVFGAFLDKSNMKYYYRN